MGSEGEWVAARWMGGYVMFVVVAPLAVNDHDDV